MALLLPSTLLLVLLVLAFVVAFSTTLPFIEVSASAQAPLLATWVWSISRCSWYTSPSSLHYRHLSMTLLHRIDDSLHTMLSLLFTRFFLLYMLDWMAKWASPKPIHWRICVNRDLLLMLKALCSYVYTVLDIKKEVSNRVDIDAAGDGVNTLAFWILFGICNSSSNSVGHCCIHLHIGHGHCVLLPIIQFQNFSSLFLIQGYVVLVSTIAPSSPWLPLVSLVGHLVSWCWLDPWLDLPFLHLSILLVVQY